MFWEGLSIVSCLKDRKFTNKIPNFTCSTGSCNCLDYLLSLKDLLALIKTKLHSKSFYYRYKNASLSLYYTTKWGGQERSASGWRLALRGGNITEKKIGEKGASQKEQQGRGCITTKIKENYTQITKTGYSQTKNTF